MPSPPALRAAKAIANSDKPKQGQTTEDLWARIIDRETGVADLLVACEAALEYMRLMRWTPIVGQFLVTNKV
jgi:hypothetical protein